MRLALWRCPRCGRGVLVTRRLNAPGEYSCGHLDATAYLTRTDIGLPETDPLQRCFTCGVVACAHYAMWGSKPCEPQGWDGLPPEMLAFMARTYQRHVPDSRFVLVGHCGEPVWLSAATCRRMLLRHPLDEHPVPVVTIDLPIRPAWVRYAERFAQYAWQVDLLRTAGRLLH
jgi:ribosomal protein S27AE